MRARPRPRTLDLAAYEERHARSVAEGRSNKASSIRAEVRAKCRKRRIAPPAWAARRDGVEEPVPELPPLEPLPAAVSAWGIECLRAPGRAVHVRRGAVELIEWRPGRLVASFPDVPSAIEAVNAGAIDWRERRSA